MCDTAKAEAFLVDAIRIFGSSAPLGVREIYRELETLRGNPSPLMSEAKFWRVVRDRMAG
jgi:hypothetical protein